MTFSHLSRRFGLASYLALCLMLGGASAAGFLGNLVLQLIGIAIVCRLLLSGAVPALVGPARYVTLLLGLGGLLLVLQIIPLPPAVWTSLPGRAGIARQYGLVGMPIPWLPISLAVDATLIALCSLIVPAAALLLTFAADQQARLYAVYTVIAVAILSVLLGLLQRFGGQDSPLYFYAFTSWGSSVGFFANRNHLATLLLMAIPFAGALTVLSRRSIAGLPRSARHGVIASLVLLLCIGVAAAQSVAGWLLLPPVLIATWVLFRRGEGVGLHSWMMRLTIIACVVAGVLAVIAPVFVTTLDQKLSRTDPHRRSIALATTVRAAADYFPVGSGGGSFVTVYPSYEDPLTISNEFLNHTHNDYAEIWLEHGVPGALLVAFALWLWLAPAKRLWQRSSLATDLQRAAFIAIGVAVLHSVVDYPVRTAAVAAVLALAAGIMTSSPNAPAIEVRRSTPRPRSRGRHATRRDPETMFTIALDSDTERDAEAPSGRQA